MPTQGNTIKFLNIHMLHIINQLKKWILFYFQISLFRRFSLRTASNKLLISLLLADFLLLFNCYQTIIQNFSGYPIFGTIGKVFIINTFPYVRKYNLGGCYSNDIKISIIRSHSHFVALSYSQYLICLHSDIRNMSRIQSLDFQEQNFYVWIWENLS